MGEGISFSPRMSQRYYPHYVLPRREIQNYRPETFDAKTAAARYIGQEICRKTREFPLTVRFETDERKEVHTIIEPTGLLSAMWYQFSLACTGEVKLRRCIICGMWENMERHRHTWSAHPNCANYRRVKRARRKKREGQRP